MIVSSEIIKSITDFLFIGQRKEELPICDLVIVLGNYFPEITMQEVSDLWQRGIISSSSRIILTGATGKANEGQRNECDQMYDFAIEEFQMPKDLFIKEKKAKNACENLLFSKTIIENLGGFDAFEHILLMGNAFMLRRVSMYAAKFDYPPEQLSYYGVVDTVGRNVGPDTWWQTGAGKDRVMAEIERIGKYYREGFIEL